MFAGLTQQSNRLTLSFSAANFIFPKQVPNIPNKTWSCGMASIFGNSAIISQEGLLSQTPPNDFACALFAPPFTQLRWSSAHFAGERLVHSAYGSTAFESQ
eukprot:Pompholyxophrys_sp_v1_NODE_80_length_2275_cov_8.699550.p4 type:complete len:101 gc:universal NODE_80_length_2275_cov_8.699550:1929-1627(-)